MTPDGVKPSRAGKPEGVETMHEAPERDDEIVRTARIEEGAEFDGNDRTTRVIWAAGFFDGEGFVSLPRVKSGARHIRIGVGQLVREPLEVLVDLWGGSIRQEVQENGKQFHRWERQSDRGADALREMLPYLRVKREQAEIALEFHDERPARAISIGEAKARRRDNTRRFRARLAGLDVPLQKIGGHTVPEGEKQMGDAYMLRIVQARP